MPTHSYLIGRQEATELGLPIEAASEAADSAMWNLYKDYETWLRLTSPYSPLQDLGDVQEKKVQYERAAIESLSDGKLSQHLFKTEKMFLRMDRGGVPQVAEQIIYEGWTSDAS